MNLSREHIIGVLGIDVPLNESISLNEELTNKNEQEKEKERIQKLAGII